MPGEPGGVGVIITAPPHAPYLSEIAAHPAVTGLRLNTVMPVKGGPGEALDRLSRLGQPLWVDLKGRQLRVREAALPPYTEVRISHPIQVETPVDVFFSDGRERVRLLAVDGDRLILEDGPKRVVGPGESVNIPHPSLVVAGTLTDTDQAYLKAMRERGLKRVMLSYVEREEDLAEVRAALPDAEILVKIETVRGMAFARRAGAAYGRMVAGRGDLYIELPRPHLLPEALRDIIAADPDAIVASRLLESLAFDPVPRSAEIMDVAFLLALGYRTFILGDQVCFQKDSLIAALNLLEALAKRES